MVNTHLQATFTFATFLNVWCEAYRHRRIMSSRQFVARNRLIKFLIAFAIFFVSNVDAATLTAKVDRTELAADESVLLTFSLVNSDTRLRAEGLSPNIDLTLLTPFFELGTPQTNYRFNISRDQGQTTSDLAIQLFPKREGSFTIPEFVVDDSKSKSIKITVLPASNEKAPEVFSRSGLIKSTIVQKEQVVIYIDLFTRVDIASAEISGDIEAEPVPLEMLNATQLPPATRTENFSDFKYTVTRRSWALFIPTSGKLSLRVPSLWIVTKAGKKLRLPGKVHYIDVKSLPNNMQAGVIIGNVQMYQNISTTQLRVGELIQWDVQLITTGALSDIPSQLSFPVTSKLKIYTTPVSIERTLNDQGVSYKAHYAFMVTPLEAGEVVLPTLGVLYKTPENELITSATLAPLKLKALPPSNTNPLTSSTIANAMPPLRKPIEVFFWPGATALVTMLWLITLYRNWCQHRKLISDTKNKLIIQPLATNSENSPKSRLLDALGSRTLEEGLTCWQKDNHIDDEVSTAIKLLQRYCYSVNNKFNEKEIDTIVNAAIKKIHQAMPSPKILPAQDSWLPQNFCTALK